MHPLQASMAPNTSIARSTDTALLAVLQLQLLSTFHGGSGNMSSISGPPTWIRVMAPTIAQELDSRHAMAASLGKQLLLLNNCWDNNEKLWRETSLLIIFSDRRYSQIIYIFVVFCSWTEINYRALCTDLSALSSWTTDKTVDPASFLIRWPWISKSLSL